MYLQSSSLKYFGKTSGKSRVSYRYPNVRHAYDGAKFVPIAVPFNCLYKTLSKMKLLFSGINFADSMIKALLKRCGIRSLLFSIQKSSACNPSSCGMLVYRLVTSYE